MCVTSFEVACVQLWRSWLSLQISPGHADVLIRLPELQKLHDCFVSVCVRATLLSLAVLADWFRPRARFVPSA
jgi:hypothetical protein